MSIGTLPFFDMANMPEDWLSLIDLKERLNIVRAERDFELTDWLSAAVQRIENKTGLPMLEREIQIPAQDGDIGYVIGYRELRDVTEYDSMEAYEDGEDGTVIDNPDIVVLAGRFDHLASRLKAKVQGFHVYRVQIGLEPADFPILSAVMTTFCRYLYEGKDALRVEGVSRAVFDELLKPLDLWGLQDAWGWVK